MIILKLKKRKGPHKKTDLKKLEAECQTDQPSLLRIKALI